MRYVIRARVEILLHVISFNVLTPVLQVFIDYGKEWEDSWNEHVKNWKPTSNEKTRNKSVSVKRLNDDTGPLSMQVS